MQGNVVTIKLHEWLCNLHLDKGLRVFLEEEPLRCLNAKQGFNLRFLPLVARIVPNLDTEPMGKLVELNVNKSTFHNF